MFAVVVWLVCFDCCGLGRWYVVRRLDVKFWETSLMIELLKALGLAFCLGCALVIGPLVLQLHVQHLELQQARQAETVLGWIENEANDTRLSEYRPD